MASMADATLLRQAGKALPLAAYVLLRGLDATVLKGLQLHGAANPVAGENPISFCNVFFVAELVVGLAALGGGGAGLRRDLAGIGPRAGLLLFGCAGLGLFLGPIAYYQALQELSVVSQTLLFSLVLPASGLLARRFLGEPLPRGFVGSTALIIGGLLLAAGSMGGAPDGPGPGGSPAVGVAWALVGVLAFSGAGVCGRRIAAKGWSVALSLGLPSTLSALVFGIVALVLFGPGHFLLLQLWWVVGVIGIYALLLTLGREISLRQAYRSFGVATVSLWGSLAIVVAALSAVALLGEPLGPATLAGLGLIVAGALRSPPPMRSDGNLRGYLP